uniref:SH2 domain-containing protein n=1 Tax=Gorilla gorilla gorilla TaxID=9595 RepID=G3R2H8_GORGO
MLKQILSEMYIDPDLLAELSEEQKQILFFKMREEQIRRWKEREAAMERKESLPVKPRPKKGKLIHVSSVDVLVEQLLYPCLLPTTRMLSPSSSSRNIQQMLADSINRMKAYAFHQKKESMKKKQEEEINQIEEERTKQICKSWKEDSEWQASLRKSKAADEKRRSLAKQAREDYKRLSLGAQKGRGGERLQSPLRIPQKPKRPPLPPKPQFLNPGAYPQKPLRNQGLVRTVSSSAQEDIIRWFKEEQLPLRAGYQKTSDTIAPWFHGILTLKKANELLLSTGMPGSFLIRVSERIKGYALSHLSEDGCKHFLIDASADAYSFLGVDQLQHATLADLVEYHKEEPITSLGKELLLYPCGQQDQLPDYLELFE